MNIVKMIGGVGNQMFQYALYKRFLEMGVDVKYDHLRTYDQHNGFVLDKIFNIVENPIESRVETEVLLNQFQENTWPRFNPDILKKENTYLSGNWQNIGYFPDLKKLRADFSFKLELDDKNQEILNEIEKTESVSVHIRKGDYTSASLVNYFFQADQMNYYGPAINYMSKNLYKPKFFVFSDDIEWAKKNIFTKATFITNNSGFNSWKDLKLMSSCKNNITANSTFSWWGAWLNKNPTKLITTPKQWFMDGTDSNEITLSHWTKI